LGLDKGTFVFRQILEFCSPVQFNIQRLAFDVPQKVETLEESQESTPQDNNERQAANNVRKVAEAGLYAFF